MLGPLYGLARYTFRLFSESPPLRGSGTRAAGPARPARCAAGTRHLQEDEAGVGAHKPGLFTTSPDASVCTLQLERGGSYFSFLAMLCLVSSSVKVCKSRLVSVTKQNMLPLERIVPTDDIC